MPRAIVLTSASKASLTGGSFADAIPANSPDSLAVANYDTGGARIVEMWGIDSAHAMEGEIFYTRPESTHDQQHGLRFQVPSLFPGGAGQVAAHNVLPGYGTVNLYKSDQPTLLVTGTAADAVLLSWVTEYDDLPGVSAVMADWTTVQALRLSTVGIFCNAVASATKGAYGAARAINADDPRLHADTWYAILGVSVQTPVCTISLLGPDWGGQRIGLPAGVLGLDMTTWFIDQSVKWNKPLIPCFNSNNAANVLVQVADSAASTAPNIDFLLYELTGKPGS